MANDLIERFQNQAASIDSIWNMFLFVHAALLASLYLKDDNKGLSWTEIVFVLVGYLSFVYINTIAFKDAYHIMQSIVQDIHNIKDSETGVFKTTLHQISETDYSFSPTETIFVHLVAAIIFLGSLLRKHKTMVSKNSAPPIAM